MADIFLKIVNLSISASWIVLAVLALRMHLKKAPKWLRPILWGIVGLRLILPFSIESKLSLIPTAEPISPEIMYAEHPAIHSGIPLVNNFVNPIISASFTPDPTASANLLQILIPVFSAVWIFGIVLMLLYSVVSYLRLCKRVATAVPLRSNIYQSEQVASPFVLGVLRPRIYLPFGMTDADMALVIAHEQAHINRRDHWVKPFGFLLLCLYWFNPLMWLAYVLLCRDIELACDERVIRELGTQARADYSEALLHCSVPRHQIAACPLAFGETGVKERVKNVLNYKKPAFWIIVLGLIACTVVAVCFLTSPAEVRESIRWTDKLTADEVARIEMVVFPQTEEKQYKLFAQEEFNDIIVLISASRGKYLPIHEDLNGGSIFFYITTKDGKTHEAGNIGNTYLLIDGDYFALKYEDALAWDRYQAGNAALPVNFFASSKTDYAVIYQVESLVYYNTHLSSFPPSPETAPLYTLTSDYRLMILENRNSNEWLCAGACAKVELPKDVPDQLSDPNQIWNETSAYKLLKNNANTWQLIVSPDLPNSVIYYILQQNNGDLYLVYACGDPAGNTVPFSNWDAINWICKLCVFTGSDDMQGCGSDIILRITDGTRTGNLVLAGEDAADVYTLNAVDDAVQIYLDGKPADASTLEDGMPVMIVYDGSISETYPARLQNVTELYAYSLGTEENPKGAPYDLCGLYLEVLNDLWMKDSGLNSGIDFVSVDLSGAPGALTDGEKAAIAWIFAGTHQLEGLTLTYDQLAEAGYLTEVDLDSAHPLYRWDDGVLFTITGDYTESETIFSPPILKFNAGKWRGPLGSYFLCRCTAELDRDGRWSSYSIGSEAIS